MKRKMSENGSQQYDENDEVEYEYNSDEWDDPEAIKCVDLDNESGNRICNDEKIVDLTNDFDINQEESQESSMKSFEILLSSLPESMRNLVADGEAQMLRMTFFLEDLNGFTVRGAKRLKPLLEQTIAVKLRSHGGAICDMDTLECFVETCIIHDFQNLYLYCPVCQDPHDTHSSSLIPCSKDECLTQFTEQGLGRDIAVEIKSDPEVVELMITMTYWASLNTTHNRQFVPNNTATASPASSNAPVDVIREANFNPFPKKFVFKGERQFDVVRESLNRLPNVQLMKDMIDSHTFSAFFRDDFYLQESYYLLTWILNSHRACLKYVKKSEQTNFEANLRGDNLHLFKIQTPPDKESAFQHAKAAAGNDNQTEYVFHGSKPGCWHGIIRNSLKCLSGTPQMTTGAAYGKGIYLGTTMQTAMSYIRMAEHKWEQNQLGIEWCILVAEKVIPHPNSMLTNSKGISITSVPSIMRVEPNENNVINRYLLCGNRNDLGTITTKIVT